MQPISTRVAAEVRASLARQGMSKTDLGRILGISAPTARSRWSGTLPYTLDELAIIADTLAVPVASLLDADSDAPAA